MQRRQFLVLIGGPQLVTAAAPVFADSSGPQLASYYDRHMAMLGGVAYGWTGRSQPVRLRAGVRQVGVSEEAFFALQDDGRLFSWGAAPESASLLMAGAGTFASGQSGWFAIDPARVLWQGGGIAHSPRRVANDVADACIGDSADYYIRSDGTLWVKGLAHRGQYGDGRLTSTADFVNTAEDTISVKAHTGHALYLRQDGVVMGTGGNRFGPLGAHGLGDKADRWGLVFDGARAIATGSRHSVAIRTDDTLSVWGGGFRQRATARSIRGWACHRRAPPCHGPPRQAWTWFCGP